MTWGRRAALEVLPPAAWMATLLCDASDGTMSFAALPWGFLGVCLFGGRGLLAMVRLARTLWAPREAKPVWRPALLALVVAVWTLTFPVLAMRHDWPLRAGFALSEGALHEYVGELERRAGSEARPRHQGLQKMGRFTVYPPRREADGAVHVNLDDCALGFECSLVLMPGRTPVSDGVDEYRHVHGAWWFLERRQ